RKLTDIEFGVYAAKSKPELWKSIEKPDDFAAFPFISFVEDLIYTPEIDYLREVSGLIVPRVRIASLVAQWHATVAGVGLCVLPCFLADTDERLVRLLPNDVFLRRTLWMVVHSDMRDIARIKATSEFIADEIRRSRDRFLPRHP